MNTVQRAIEAGATFAEDKQLAPDEARMTLPSLSVQGGRHVVVFAYHMAQTHGAIPRQPRKIYFPFLEMHVTVPGYAATADKISADDFGLVIPARDYIGDLSDLSRFGLDQYEEQRDLYEALLSTILDEGWLTSPALSEATRSCARQLSEVLSEIIESALEPYYDVSMKSLRDWLLGQGHPLRTRERSNPA